MGRLTSPFARSIDTRRLNGFLRKNVKNKRYIPLNGLLTRGWREELKKKRLELGLSSICFFCREKILAVIRFVPLCNGANIRARMHVPCDWHPPTNEYGFVFKGCSGLTSVQHRLFIIFCHSRPVAFVGVENLRDDACCYQRTFRKS